MNQPVTGGRSPATRCALRAKGLGQVAGV